MALRTRARAAPSATRLWAGARPLAALTAHAVRHPPRGACRRHRGDSGAWRRTRVLGAVGRERAARGASARYMTGRWLFVVLLTLYLFTAGGKGYSIDGAFGYEMAKTVFLDP